MQMDWISRQGRARRTNNDAAAIGFNEHLLVAILVDAAEKGGRGQGLARHWAQTIVSDAIRSQVPLDSQVLTQIMRQQQRQLRHHYLHEIASYCLVWLDIRDSHYQVLHVGDCLAGMEHGDGPQWSNSPHNATRQLAFFDEDASQADLNQRHLLTRSLNAKRFSTPDYHASDLPLDGSLVLCSDGYWSEHLEQGTPLDQLDDDASLLRLTITSGPSAVNRQTDTDNLIIVPQ